jgi:rod shape-determining protein MreB
VIGKRVFSRPRAVLSISSMTNELERRQLLMGMLEAGARRTQILARPLAAAVGSGLKIMPPIGHMIIDIGGANSHVAAIASGQMMAESTDICGGDAFTEAIVRYVRLKHNLLIGFRTAEDIKCAIGTVRNLGDTDLALPIAGRNLVSGLPKQIDITRNEVTEAMEDSMRAMLEGIRGVIERLPPELANDVFNNGIMLTGGGAQLKGLQEVISEDIKVRCYTAEDPQHSVAAGCGYVLERMEEFGALLGDSRRKK